MRLPSFYPVLDTASWSRIGISIQDACEAILEGGARILQFRHKGHFSRAVLVDAERVAELCEAAGAQFVINDRADVAALFNGALHVGQEDLRPSEVRRILPGTRGVGFSTHNEQQIRAAAEEPADYLALGPIFTTGSKDRADPVVGLKELERLRGLVNKPLVAIGGITRESAHQVLRAGADSVAVIGDLIPEEHTCRAVRSRTEEWLQLLKT